MIFNFSSKERADEIYRIGVARRAQPLERLKKKYHDFQERLLIRPEDEDSEEKYEGSVDRAVLGVKVGNSQSYHFNNIAVGDKAKGSIVDSKKVEKMKKMSIFPDSAKSGSMNKSAPWKELGIMAVRNKENIKDAVPWKGQVLPAKGTSLLSDHANPSGRTKLQVYHDEVSTFNTNFWQGEKDNNAAEKSLKPHESQSPAFALKIKKTEGQLLLENPLMNFTDTPAAISPSSKIATNPLPETKESEEKRPPEDSKAHIIKVKERSKKPLKTSSKPASAKQEKLIIDKNKLYDSMGIEMQFEELRAQELNLYKKEFPSPVMKRLGNFALLIPQRNSQAAN